MKKINKDALENFVYVANLTTRNVEIMIISQLIVCFVAFLFSYNQEFIVAFLSPLVLGSVVIYIVALNTKAANIKRINLLVGLSGIFATLTCIISCVLIIPMSWLTVIKILVFLFLLNLLIIFFMVWDAVSTVRSNRKNFLTGGTLITGGISIGVVLGRVVSRTVNSSIHVVLIFCFMVFSCAFSLSFICIMRFYYAKVLDKFEPEREK